MSGRTHHCCEYAIREKCKVDLCNRAGESALLLASQNGHCDIVKLLLEKNANVDQCNSAGESPLYKACQKGCIDIVKLLLERNLNVDLFDNNDCSPLLQSNQKGHTDILNLLLTKNSNIDSYDNMRVTLLIKSCLKTTRCTKWKSRNCSTIVKNCADCNICFNSKDALLDRKQNEIFTILVNNTSKSAAYYVRKKFLNDLAEYPYQYTITSYKNSTSVYYALYIVAGSSPLHMACFMGWTDVVHCLLEHKANINMAKEDGTTPLSYACEVGHTEIVEILLDQNANIDQCDNDGFTPLIKSCLNNHTSTVQLLIEYKADINARTVDGTYGLFFSALNGNLEITKLLLENNADCNNCIHSKQLIIESLSGHPNETVHDKMTDFLLSLKWYTRSNNSTIQLLMQHKPDINAKALHGLNALVFSAMNGNLEIIKLLLRNGADCNICCDSKESIKGTSTNLTKKTEKQKKQHIFNFVYTLSSIVNRRRYDMAVQYKWIEFYSEGSVEYDYEEGVTYISEELLDHVLRVVTDSSPLHIACFMLRTDVVRCLLEHKANINMAKEDGTTPLSYACEVGNTDIVQILLEKNANIDICDNDGFTPLIKSCLNKNISIIQLLTKLKPDINERTVDGANGLFFSAMYGNKAIAQILLQNTADCNICTYSKERMISTFKDHAKKSFEQKKQDIFDIFRNISSRNVRQHVIKKSQYQFWTNSLDYVSIRKKAVDYVFDVVADSSPLHIACFMGRTKVVRCLLDHNANINMAKNDGTTPLSYACEVGHIDIVKINDGLSPLQIASRAGHTDIVRLLLEKNPNVDCISKAIWSSCFLNNSSIVELLVKHKPDINVQAIDGSCALFHSALNGNIEIVQLLLENNADCNICCPVGHEDIVQLLLDKGADTQICRLDEKFPLNIATDNGHESVIIMLRKHSENQHTVSS
ncbi:unnamed protein product [Mytilus edulis]|uniref:Uncharacterized protein n=1 Tax=Mytilus edulis TaxID=6550 RepID=A0A8S3QY81_MYTED|nr:unnamed protein product [Mytilus edulis]